MKQSIIGILLTVAIVLILPWHSIAHAQTITHTVVLDAQQHRITGLAVSKNGKSFGSIGADGTLKLWGLMTNTELSSMKTGNSALRKVAIHPSGKWIATGDRDSTINIVDVKTKRSLQSIKIERRLLGGIQCLEFSPDGKYLLSTDDSLTLWRVTNEKQVLTPHKRLVRGGLYATISPDSKSIAFIDFGRVILYQIESGKYTTLLRLRGTIINLAFSPDGRFLFGYRRFLPAEVVQIDIKNKKKLSPFNIEAFGYAISPNGKWIAILDKDYKSTKCLAKVFDVITAKPILTLRFTDPVAISTGPIVFTPDNSKLITAVDSRIYIWDLPKKLLKK